MKTHFKKLRNPNYLGSWDLMDDKGNYIEKVLTVKLVRQEQVFDGKGGSEQLPVMYFNGVDKGLVMNATNGKAMYKITGTWIIEDWTGVSVTLYVTRVKAFGDIHDALRVKGAVNAQPSKPQLDATRFEKALKKVEDGSFPADRLLAEYGLTEEQKMRLNDLLTKLGRYK